MLESFCAAGSSQFPLCVILQVPAGSIFATRAPVKFTEKSHGSFQGTLIVITCCFDKQIRQREPSSWQIPTFVMRADKLKSRRQLDEQMSAHCWSARTQSAWHCFRRVRQVYAVILDAMPAEKLLIILLGISKHFS